VMSGRVFLRAVNELDLPVFFEQQRDPESNAMAAFPPRERDAHTAHWAKIMADHSTLLRTIQCDGAVAGHIVSWNNTGSREVGYWLGREYWGQGIATQALALFLEEEPTRPLVAHVAKHNIGSRRVLEKCGFVVVSAAGMLPMPGADPIPEFTLRLG
jgi:RimJ/RimL family protein N-acetyltransferase